MPQSSQSEHLINETAFIQRIAQENYYAYVLERYRHVLKNLKKYNTVALSLLAALYVMELIRSVC